jgi:hypothetical protein
MAKMTGHPGFAAVQKKIAGRYGMKAAGAILAKSTRNASPAAKRKNPRLENVRMPKRMSSRLSKRGMSR